MFKRLKYLAIIGVASIIISSLTIFFLNRSETKNPLRPIAKFWQGWQSEAIKKQKITNNHILSKQVTAHAQVGGGYILNRLSGYTSPFAEIQLNSVNLTRKTSADETGYFIFTNIPVLPSRDELCLISQDVNLLPSFPTCLAPPPSNQDIDIIDILLSPSLSIGSPIVPNHRTITASGMTFPNSEVNVYLFSVNDNFSIWLKKLSFIKTAYAFGLPKYKTKSNSDGHFEFSLPNSNQSVNRFFVASALNVGGRRGEDSTSVSGINDVKGNQGDKGDKGNETLPKQTNPALKENLAPDGQGEFLPKTNIGAQAIGSSAIETDLRESPKSNTLYFRSLGWFENLLNRMTAFFTYLINIFSNALALILIEIIIILVLLLVIIYYRLRKDTALY